MFIVMVVPNSYLKFQEAKLPATKFLASSCLYSRHVVERAPPSILNWDSARQSIFICLESIIWNTRRMYDFFKNLTMKTEERCQWFRSFPFIVNFEQVSQIPLLFPSLTLSK